MLKRASLIGIFVCAVMALNAVAQEPDLTEEQMQKFLLTAKVIKSKQTSKGVTSPYRLTLSDGTVTHDAAFQAINVRKTQMQFSDGKVEMNFVDSYKYDIAAYELAKLLGLGPMMPVTVERKWNGNTGALSWWIPTKLDEESRLRQKVQPPDVDAWNRQMWKMRVFAQLVYDTDRNLGNVLITEDWRLYMIDFSRAFRLFPELRNPKDLTNCDRQLLDKLKGLTEESVTQSTKQWLTKAEIRGVMARRDKIVELFEKMGKDVLY